MKQNDSAQPEAALDAIHSILHEFAPENHETITIPLEGHNSVNGFKFHPELTDRAIEASAGTSVYGFLGFDTNAVKLSLLILDAGGNLTFQIPLDSFDYADRKLLRHIAEALPQAGVEIPERLNTMIDELQADLDKS